MMSNVAAKVVTTMASGRKASQLYPYQHPAFVETMDALLAAVQEATATGSIQLNLHEGRIYHESSVLPEDAPGILAIEEVFESRRIESMTLHQNMTMDEAIGLVEVIGLKPSPSLDVEEELKKRNVNSVTIAILEDEDSEEREERERLRAQDRALYNRLIGIMRTMSTQVANGSGTDLDAASGIVGNVLGRLMDDQAAVLGLASIRGHDESGLFHSVNVMIYSLTLGSALGLPEEGLASLGLSALLHDIGKAAFNLDDPAQAEPAHLMHPTIGADILSRLPDEDKSPMLVAYEHHMCPDGSGPPGRPADYISHPYSRMVAIANRYANLIDPGASAEALTPDKAIVQVLREAGSLLDPMFTRLFAKAMGVFPVGCLVRLSDQSVGVVSKSGDGPLAPVVKIIYGADGLELEEPIEADLDETDLEIIEVVDPESLNEEISERL